MIVFSCLLSSAMSLLFLLNASAVLAQERLSEEVQAAARSGIVQVIVTSDVIPRRSATGFRWQSTDMIVTAYHLVAGADSITVQSTLGGINATEARVIAVDHSADLALLQTNRLLPGEPLVHRSGPILTGERLWVVGYPLDVAGLRSRRLVMSEIAPKRLEDAVDAVAKADLEALGFPKLNEEVIQLEGDLLPGDSGAPIIDSNGYVVAIGSGGLQNGQVGLGWGIPANRLLTLPAQTQEPPALSVSALQTLQTSFFSSVPRERVDETLYATAAQKDTLEAYRDYLARFPTGAFAIPAQTRLADFERRYEQALAYYRRAMEYMTTLGAGGEVDFVREMHDRTQYNLRRAISVYPRFEAAHFELGRSTYLMASLLEGENEKREAYKDAIDDFNDAIDLSPEMAEVYLYRGFSFAGISDYRYACEDYINFNRLRSRLSPPDFERHRQQLRFSREFLEYHGCDIPDNIDFIGSRDNRGDQDNVKRDCRPAWWDGEAEYCAELGHAEAMARVADKARYLSGSIAHLSVEETEALEQAVRFATILAEAGDPRGQYQIGSMYWNGVGKAYDPELAFMYIKLATDSDYPDAFHSLGSAVFDGLIAPPDPAGARFLWARGSVLGDQFSASRLDDFDDTASLFLQRLGMFEDFRALLERGSCAGYSFRTRGEMANRFEAECIREGPDALTYYAIEGLGAIKSRASDAVPILLDFYPQADEFLKERIIYALKQLRYLTPAAGELLADIAVSGKPDAERDRINLDGAARTQFDALNALAAAGPLAEPVADRIMPLLHSPNRQVRLSALGVLGETRNTVYLQSIMPLLNDQSLMVRLEAERYIAELSGG